MEGSVFEGTRARVRLRAGGVRRAHGRARSSPGDVVVIRYEGPKGSPGMPEMLAVTAAVAGAGLGKDVALITDGTVQRGDEGHQRRAHRARGVRRRPDRAARGRRPDPDRHRRPHDRGARRRRRARAAPRVVDRARTEVHAGRAGEVRAHGRLGRHGGDDVVTPATIATPAGARVPDLPCALPGRAAHDLRGVLRPPRARLRPRGDRRRRVPPRGRGRARNACGATSRCCRAGPTSSGSTSAPGSRLCGAPTTSPRGWA